MKEAKRGGLKLFPRREMLELVVINGQARGIVCRNLITGQLECYAGDAVVLATGGYSNIYYLSTNAKACNVTAIWRAHKRGAYFANPCFTQIHPTCIPVHGEYQSKLVLMSESLRNDGRVWVPKNPHDKRPPSEIPDEGRDYFLERRYPAYGNLAPRDIASRAAKTLCDTGCGVGPRGMAVYLDFRDAISHLGRGTMEDRYGNLFEIYEKVTGQNGYETPMMIYPAPHYTMGGLWVDYNLMSNLSGLFAIGEANFSDHGANRLGASALMQGLADGYFILPYTIGHYFATTTLEKAETEYPEFKGAVSEAQRHTDKLLSINGKRTVDDFHRELGLLMWNQCGMSRDRKGLLDTMERIRAIREEFWENVIVTGSPESLNQSLEKAGRVADFLEFAELLAYDALMREESCGCHFREEYQTEDGEALRNDEEFCYVAAWEFPQADGKPILHKEPLEYVEVPLAVRTYK